MRRWIHSLMILYSILGLCQLQPLIQESEQLASQWVEIVQGEVKGSIVGEDGKPVIAQLRFFDSDGALIKRIQTDIDGNFEILLDEGHYNLEVSKGYEYEMKQLPIEVKKENPLNLKSISLTRLMDWTAKSYLCGDLHQHSQFSDDGLNTVEEVLIANLANGLDFGAMADHNTVDGNDEWLSLSQKLSYLAIPAQEITTNQGHYLALNTSNLIDVTALTSEDEIDQMIDETHHQGGMIQINHPGRNFPFWNVGGQFDAIEIWNGQAMPPIPNLNDIDEEFAYNQISKQKWFDLLSEGAKLTALGNSDNHDISSESITAPISENEQFNEWIAQGLYNGNPRNYVKVEEESVEGILKGIKDGHVFITNGPLMDVTLNEATFGDRVVSTNEAEISYLIASNQGSLEALNVIADGQVIETIPLAEDVPTLGTINLNLSNYQWVVFEVISKSYEYAISNPIYLK